MVGDMCFVGVYSRAAAAEILEKVKIAAQQALKRKGKQ
jgi:hypothetical protein